MKINKIIWLLLIFEIACQPDKEYTYYDNGAIKSEFTRKDEKVQGEAKYFYPTGEEKAREYYEDGLKMGEALSYYKSGEIKSVKNYRNGKSQGLFAYYRRNGTLEGVDRYEEDSVISSAAFDSTGSFYKSTYQPVFMAESDTIIYGEPYTFTVGLDGEPLGKIKILLGQYDRESNILSDTIVSADLNKRVAIFSFIPNHKGQIVIAGELEDYFSVDKDSLRIGYTNAFEFKKHLYVEHK